MKIAFQCRPHIITVRRPGLYAVFQLPYPEQYPGRIGRTIMRLCELREKEVINACDCKRLGCVVDLDFDPCSGEILAIIVPGPGKICGFLGTDREFVIPFRCIKKIGPDIILVEIQEDKFLKNI